MQRKERDSKKRLVLREEERKSRELHALDLEWTSFPVRQETVLEQRSWGSQIFEKEEMVELQKSGRKLLEQEIEGTALDE